ncbi:MAG: NYN domain-containing protein [Verrucomicrobiaceae bacterium]|nr:NYN domain-containing protein [Verrucomicrobiaceae bacterium]
MTSTESAAALKVAMYWDFENIHASLHEQDIGFYKEARFKPQPELVDVAAIMDFARSVGSVCINRAYCNWSFFSRYADALSGVGMELMQLFSRGQHGKNGADIQMCVDMVEDLLRLEVDVCVIVSGDSDFIGAAQKARQYGKRVIGIGVRGFSNRFFQRVCDEFKFYDMLVQQEVATPVTLDDSGKMSLEAAKGLLVAAVSRLATQFGDPAVLKARVKPMMLRLEPSFDERGVIAGEDDAGFANFPMFLDACSDVIEEAPGDGDHTIRLRSGVVEAAAGTQMSEERRQKCRRLLTAAMTFILRNRDIVPMAAVKVVMLKLEPAFDEKKLGAKNLLTFLQWFPDIVAIHGEGEKRTLELLVEKNEGEYTPPPLPPAKLSDVLPPVEVIRAAMPFHFESLCVKPADGWPDYYERMQASIEESGFVIEKPGLQAIKKLVMDVKGFKMLPNQGGISFTDGFASIDDLWACVSDHLSRVLAAPGNETQNATS